MPNEIKFWSVIIVGGGVAGLQAALDLADSGFWGTTLVALPWHGFPPRNQTNLSRW